MFHKSKNTFYNPHEWTSTNCVEKCVLLISSLKGPLRKNFEIERVAECRKFLSSRPNNLSTGKMILLATSRNKRARHEYNKLGPGETRKPVSCRNIRSHMFLPCYCRKTYFASGNNGSLVAKLGTLENMRPLQTFLQTCFLTVLVLVTYPSDETNAIHINIHRFFYTAISINVVGSKLQAYATRPNGSLFNGI